MKNLWTVLPPLFADNFGCIEVLRQSDGCGVVDDSGTFRLKHLSQAGSPRQEGRDERRGRGGRGGHGGRGGEGRTAVSGARNEDVITGTRERMLQASRDIAEQYHPSFLMLSAGPCGAMIGTDLHEIADALTAELGIPVGVSDLTGQKAYDTGISKTLEAAAKLLVKPAQREPGAVNLIGSTPLDWAETDLAAARQWLEHNGYHVISQPGSRVTAAEIAQMSKAEVNLVTSVSGLAMARYLEETYGTPYLAAAPFGEANCGQILKGLAGTAPTQPEGAGEAPDTLIIAEQFTANAIRNALESSGNTQGAHAATFYLLDKRCARAGDRRIKGEADAKALLGSGKYARVIADPLLRPFAAPGTQWIDLAHRAFNTYGDVPQPELFGGKTDEWLSKNL